MRIAVITCDAYRDCWQPWKELLSIFWPECPYKLSFHAENHLGEAWCSVIARAAKESDDVLMVFQEDFFLTAPVQPHLIEYAIEQMGIHGAGMVRLYPCPGSNQDYGDPYFGIVTKGTPYRISCQASIWRPDYLYAIASQCGNGPASAFEIQGSQIADTLPDTVLAFKRDVQPWPLEYLCSGISRGLWNPDSIKLCQQHGIKADLTRRPVAAS